MISGSQGAPFLLNFDERSMAGMMREADRAGCGDLIRLDNVHDYAPVGCLENTMVGNDRSGTVDNNLNLLKAVELALTGGRDLLPFHNPMTGRTEPITQDGPPTGNAAAHESWEDFWNAYSGPDRIHYPQMRRHLRSLGIGKGAVFPDPLSLLPGPGMRRKGTGCHPGRGRIEFHHT